MSAPLRFLLRRPQAHGHKDKKTRRNVNGAVLLNCLADAAARAPSLPPLRPCSPSAACVQRKAALESSGRGSCGVAWPGGCQQRRRHGCLQGKFTCRHRRPSLRPLHPSQMCHYQHKKHGHDKEQAQIGAALALGARLAKANVSPAARPTRRALLIPRHRHPPVPPQASARTRRTICTRSTRRSARRRRSSSEGIRDLLRRSVSSERPSEMVWGGGRGEAAERGGRSGEGRE